MARRMRTRTVITTALRKALTGMMSSRARAGATQPEERRTTTKTRRSSSVVFSMAPRRALFVSGPRQATILQQRLDRPSACLRRHRHHDRDLHQPQPGGN
ncbi:unnamed protein product [Linum tenue]|uniref:Uncharacterized protein n=1 Tax=Linum tenue TaxID=586396 RepID=A0AAV0QFE1_9ROSI|nr:unnamed protein product [Linum tenue]